MWLLLILILLLMMLMLNELIFDAKGEKEKTVVFDCLNCAISHHSVPITTETVLLYTYVYVVECRDVCQYNIMYQIDTHTLYVCDFCTSRR